MKVTATFAWFVITAVDVPDDATDEQQREALENSIEDFAPSGSPVLHECSNPELID